MAEYRDVRRIAPWWMCALVLVIFNFFAWMIWVNAAAPVKEGVYTRVPIPPFFLFAYLTLACLFNRRSVIATREGVRLSNFPVPLLSGETIPADRITLCYYYSVMTTSDGGGEPFAIGHVIGVETRDGRQVDLSEQFKTLIEARNASGAMSWALNEGRTGVRVESRQIHDIRDDPRTTRRGWIWAGIWASAFAAGAAWELVFRTRL